MSIFNEDLDSFRHKEYPSDLKVCVFHENNNIEMMWVTAKFYDNRPKTGFGILLNKSILDNRYTPNTFLFFSLVKDPNLGEILKAELV